MSCHSADIYHLTAMQWYVLPTPAYISEGSEPNKSALLQTSFQLNKSSG